MKHVRIGVIGIGNMGTSHATRLHQGEVKRCELTAVCDTNPAKMAGFEGKVKTFESSEELIRSGEVDAVIIATPHYSHTTIGIDALENGLHVLVEKPISVHKADCERLIAAHANTKQVFSAMFQMRTYPLYKKVKQLIDSGELGAIHRINWIITAWFRSEMYYASGGWRATWKGEGGGVLLNQCPHNLDLFQWYFGMPSRVHGFCRFGHFHNIEVEDDVTAYLEYEDGKTAILVATTGETPGTNRLEIAAERGRLVVEDDRISFLRNETPTTEFSQTTQSAFGRPGVWKVEIPTAPQRGAPHMTIVANFVEAILDGAPLIAPAEDGIHSVELANAILHATFTGKPAEMPLDAAAYEKALMKRIEGSTFQKKEPAQDVAPSDFSKSFQ